MDADQAEVHIKNIIDNHTYIVDQEMLDWLKEQSKKKQYSNYDNVLALALEYSLRKVGKLSTLPKRENEKYQWRHDWAYSSDILIDLKRRPIAYKNTSLGNLQRAAQSYNMKEVTHYVIYTTNKEKDLQVGDVLTFKFEDMIDVKEAHKLSFKLQNSKGEDFSLFPPRYRFFKD